MPNHSKERQQLGKIYDVLQKNMKEAQNAAPMQKVKTKLEKERKPVREIVRSTSSEPMVGDYSKLDRNLVTIHDPSSYEAEQIKKLRTSLLFSHNEAPLRCLMITSSLPGEGKSFVASNLAISISQILEENVLLIDCDLHKSDLHTRFGFGKSPGLSDYIDKNVSLSSLLLKTPIAKLTILPGGQPSTNPTELLSSKRMTELIVEVKTRYEDRVVILDTPPPQMAAETASIVNMVDGVVIVVKSGSTPKNSIQELSKILGTEKIRGVVMNHYHNEITSYHGKYSSKRYVM